MPIAIPLYQGGRRGDRTRYPTNFTTLVDDDLPPELWAKVFPHYWIVKRGNQKGGPPLRYAARYKKINGKSVSYFLHRELMGLPPGRYPKVDHQNTDGLDNQRSNLRLATDSQNQANKRKRKSSKGRWVGYTHVGERYQARIVSNHLGVYLGVFDTEVEAALAHNHAASLLFDKFANPNTIPPEELPSPQRQREIQLGVEERLRRKGLWPKVAQE